MVGDEIFALVSMFTSLVMQIEKAHCNVGLWV